MTATEVVTQQTHDVQRDQRTGRMLPTAVAVGGLWLATALSSVFAPDLISDAQDHVPIAAITIWPWAAVATGFVLFGAAFPTRDQMARWGLPVAVLGIWAAVALVSIFAPTLVAGSGQTIVPIAGLFAPVAVRSRRGTRAWRLPGRQRRNGAFEYPPAPRRPSVEHHKV
jgi:peptidoglycan/LPS O-acetylase OafA/YrhL